MINMIIDWARLAADIGSIGENYERGGTVYAELALEQILGKEAIHTTVNYILDGKQGSELAISVLQHIVSLEAVEFLYYVYKNSEGEKAAYAVSLIKRIAHPRSREWIEEFLADENVALWGIGLLDQLVWSGRVQPKDIEDLLVLAEHHYNEYVREQAASIRTTIQVRGD
jgi:hypothetical protein